MSYPAAARRWTIARPTRFAPPVTSAMGGGFAMDLRIANAAGNRYSELDVVMLHSYRVRMIRGRLVSTGWRRWWWHAEDARWPRKSSSKLITANSDVAGRVGFTAAPVRMAA